MGYVMLNSPLNTLGRHISNELSIRMKTATMIYETGNQIIIILTTSSMTSSSPSKSVPTHSDLHLKVLIGIILRK